MKTLPTLSLLALASALAVLPITSPAQEVVQPIPGTTDADRLGEVMRRVAASPTDVSALVEAGELSIKLDDLSGAASLFARAEKVDPHNARVKAGMAAILVRAERPGEALRYFGEAETYGIPLARIAADRGLAYDLVGEQDRAQRQYRLALRAGSDDETVRRYALSLGISGRKDQALAELDPLIRRSDRGAWRARAFVLAMNGDVSGATRIATTMMPGGTARGLQPFFERLPGLAATDRAFAVHFGEVRATPERLADARLVPPMTPLAPEPQPVALAAVTPQQAPDRGRGRGRRDRRGTQVAAVAPAPRSPAVQQQPAYAPPQQPAYTPAPAQLAAARVQAPVTQRQPSSHAATPAPLVASAPPVSSYSSVTTAARVQPIAPVQTAGAAVPGGATQRSTDTQPGAVPQPTNAFSADRTQLAANASPVSSPPVSGVTAVPVAASTAPAAAQLASAYPPPAAAAPVTATSSVEGASSPAPGFSDLGANAPVEVAHAATPVTPARGGEDMVLARIIANLSIPGSELGVAPPPRSAAETRVVAAARTAAAQATADRQEAIARIAGDERPARKPTTTARAAQEEAEVAGAAAAGARDRGARGRGARDRARGEQLAAADTRRPTGKRAGSAAEDEDTPVADKRKAGSRLAAKDEDAPGKRKANGRAVSRDDDADAPASTRRKGGDRKALADDGADAKGTSRRKGAADKPDKKLAEKKPSEPERIWVQVATGANEKDLDKAWSNVRSKAPDAFRGKSGYTTPLRATNRVVTGPFKTAAEAQAFVNSLAKKGLAGSTFTSDAGQKVSRLNGKTSGK